MEKTLAQWTLIGNFGPLENATEAEYMGATWQRSFMMNRLKTDS